MTPYSTLSGQADSRIVLCCEHATNVIPPAYSDLGVSPSDLADHIGWDIGAAEVVHYVAHALRVPAVLAGVSRLLIDCNRAQDDDTLIVQSSDGIPIPGNHGIDQAERERRVASFYRPYHDAVDQLLAQHPKALLLSVHSFTPELRIGGDAGPRSFDAGVLYDEYRDLAGRLGRRLELASLSVRYNEPYSGLSGLIFSAKYHGLRHNRRYLELELNNGRLRTTDSSQSVARRVATAIEAFLEEA
jgi:predicted N-formylglutamate amidohydrolase